MEADFSGYVTKAGLKCSDGRTILPNAFAHQDAMQVPLVWQHGHTDPESVLGHVILEHRDDGVYGYGFFNSSDKAKAASASVAHGDVKMMSIWANELLERQKRVMHGVIREVSLVLSGANPGALIDSVTIRHSDGEEEVLDDEAVIYTGLEFDNDLEHSTDGEETLQDIYDTFTEKQRDVLNYIVGEAVSSATAGEASHSNLETEETEEIEETEETGEETEETGKETEENSVQHSNTKEGDDMSRSNVFEKDSETGKTPSVTLAHSDMVGMFAEATKNGSLKEAVEGYALSHGIESIDLLFPDAMAPENTPEFLSRRMEWVNNLLGKTHKSPFSRIKTLHADITEDEARAKGYITGHMKREEFFGLTKRVTTPTTIYKKQKLDRDDLVDITDFDVVAWLKSEMRVMLDEELARAVLIGDGRDPSNEDKINEQNIRPIAKDHELYAPTIYVNIDDANSSVQEIIDACVLHRSKWKGTGLPTFYTTELYIAKFLLLKDTVGRRIYKSLDEVATELRVSEIIPVEVMEDEPSIVGILVNPSDYNLGADKGGNVSMFDDFDIDYNQYKYLIETRCSGALTKLKSALVIRKVAGSAVKVVPAQPGFNGTAVTIVNQTGVVYKNAVTDAVINAAGSPYTVADGVTMKVSATPAAGYYFETSDDDYWEFENPVG